MSSLTAGYPNDLLARLDELSFSASIGKAGTEYGVVEWDSASCYVPVRWIQVQLSARDCCVDLCVMQWLRRGFADCVLRTE